MIHKASQFSYPQDPALLYPHNPSGDWVLEIGFGDGRFWQEEQHHMPTSNYLGIEVSGVSLLKAEKRLQDGKVPNAIVTRMLAQPLLKALLPNNSVHRVYVNFPDPWVKHPYNRLLQASFFELLSGRLKLGGELWFTTDHEEYFQFACQEAQHTGLFDVLHTHPPEAALKTKYARKWQDLGFDVYHARFQVKSQVYIPHTEVYTVMPHSIFVQPNIELSGFHKQVYRYDSTTVVLLDAYQNLREGGYVILSHIEEQGLTQEILVHVIPRDEGVLVKVGKFGAPLITEGVKQAVGSVTSYIEALGYKVLHRAY